MTDNGFRDRSETPNLQGFLRSFASLFASQTEAPDRFPPGTPLTPTERTDAPNNRPPGESVKAGEMGLKVRLNELKQAALG
jgi:hypothetical protein